MRDRLLKDHSSHENKRTAANESSSKTSRLEEGWVGTVPVQKRAQLMQLTQKIRKRKIYWVSGQESFRPKIYLVFRLNKMKDGNEA